MILLVIDTSLQGVTIGLAKREGASYEILELYGSNQPQEAAARLPELCQSLLMKQNLSLINVDTMLVSNGPGSFTGIKIGLSFASGWKRAGTPIKMWCVSSFQALLRHSPDFHTLVLPATQTAGYLCLRSRGSAPSGPDLGVLDLSLSPVALRFDAASDSLIGLDPSDLKAVGILGRWARMEEWLSCRQIQWSTLATENLYRSIVASMIEEFIAKSDQLSEGKLVPIYLRKSAPEEKLDALKAKS